MHIVRLVYSSSCFLPSVHVLAKYLAKRLWIWRYVCGVCFFSTTSPIVNLAPCRMGFRNKVACAHTGAKVKVESLRGSQLGVPCISWRLLTYIILFIPGQLGKPKRVGVHPTSDVGLSFPSSRRRGYPGTVPHAAFSMLYCECMYFCIPVPVVMEFLFLWHEATGHGHFLSHGSVATLWGSNNTAANKCTHFVPLHFLELSTVPRCS